MEKAWWAFEPGFSGLDAAGVLLIEKPWGSGFWRLLTFRVASRASLKLASSLSELESEEQLFGECLLEGQRLLAFQEQRRENAPAIEWVSSTHATT